MGLFTFTCPVTGETITLSNVPAGEEARPHYGARATAEEIDAYEKHQRDQADLFHREWAPTFKRYPHQEHPPENT